MTQFVIVKYATLRAIKAAGSHESVVGTHTAQQLGITTRVYRYKANAERDLERLNAVNPSVDYGVVEYDSRLD